MVVTAVKVLFKKHVFPYLDIRAYTIYVGVSLNHLDIYCLCIRPFLLVLSLYSKRP